jgi:hypothetical protein
MLLKKVLECDFDDLQGFTCGKCFHLTGCCSRLERDKISSRPAGAWGSPPGFMPLETYAGMNIIAFDLILAMGIVKKWRMRLWF